MEVTVYVSYSTPGGQAVAEETASSLEEAIAELNYVKENLCSFLEMWLTERGIDTRDMSCDEIIDVGVTYGVDAEPEFRNTYASIRALKFIIDYFEGQPVEEWQRVTPGYTMTIEIEEEA